MGVVISTPTFLKRIIEISDKIICIFYSDTESYQRVGETYFEAFLTWYAGMRHGGRVSDERFYAAERFGQREQLCAAQNPYRIFHGIIFQIEGHHCSEHTHLAFGHLMIRVRTEAWPIYF